MLNLTPTPNTHRQADNLIPLENNQYETRYGFFQVASEAISTASNWGEAVIVGSGQLAVGSKSDESAVGTGQTENFPLQTENLYIWHGGITESIDIPPEILFTGTLFQSLTSLGNRENRLYLSNGNGLYYLHRTPIPGGTVTGATVEPGEITVLVGTKTQLTGEPVPKWAVNPAMTWASTVSYTHLTLPTIYSV